MKKGFTLVELLGVIVVLAIVLIISVPTIINTFRRTNQNDFDTYLQNLYMATESYIESNRNYFEQLNVESGKAFISIKFLEEKGLIRQTVIDPETDDTVNNNFTIVAERLSSGMIDYSFERFKAGIDMYEQEGLVLHYDAINNNGKGFRFNNYMQDLTSSNNDIILIDKDRWTVNSLKFENSNDVLNSARKIKPSLLGEDFTIELVLRQSGTSTSYVGIRDFAYLEFSSTDPLWHYGSSNTHGYSSSYSMGEPYRLALINNGSLNNSIIYLNDNSEEVSDYIQIGDDNHFIIGDGSNYFEGEIHSIRVYNRSLSSEEINRNYQVDVKRFDFQEDL